MRRFEYKTTLLNARDEAAASWAKLDDAGNNSWELVAVTDPGDAKVLLWFKREIPEAPRP